MQQVWLCVVNNLCIRGLFAVVYLLFTYWHAFCVYSEDELLTKRRCIMPRGDRTGPEGKGPMTGRGAGQCAGNSVVPGAGAGRGLGRGLGRGASGRGQGQGRGLGRNRA